jgi:hypothetical protein
MADLSTQDPCGLAQRVATALLRATGGTSAILQMPPLTGDPTDAGQLGLDASGFLSLPLAPAVLQKPPRFTMQDGQLPKYELLVSADSVNAQVAQQKLASAEALFAMAAGVQVAGRLFLIEAVSSSVAQGQPYLYRLLLQESCQPQ